MFAVMREKSSSIHLLPVMSDAACTGKMAMMRPFAARQSHPQVTFGLADTSIIASKTRPCVRSRIPLARLRH